jgi:LytS/YehU family sensor histidine kinase
VRREAFFGLDASLIIGFLALCTLAALRMVGGMMISADPAPWFALFVSSFGRELARYAPVLVLVAAAVHRVRSAAWRGPAIAAAVLAGCLIGWLMTAWIEGDDPATVIRGFPGNWDDLGGFPFLVNLCLLAGLGAATYFFHIREIESAQASQREEIRRVNLESQMSEARLKVMEAQIEPHFLFNALANIQRLFQTDPAAGKAMLRQLSRYLSAALPRMREAESTLGRELELTTAYLGVQQIRMGRRLTFDVDVPEELKGATIPPMMLATLVENAIRHGLGPLPEGGYLKISARVDGPMLRLQVADTGRGFEAYAGAGVGLANIRSRLAAQHGARARLSITRNSPRGVTATLVLPRIAATNHLDRRCVGSMITQPPTSLDAHARPRVAALFARALRRLRPRHFLYAVGVGVLLGGLRNYMQPLVVGEDVHVNFNMYAGPIVHVIALLLAIVVADEVAGRMRRPWIAYVISIGVAAVAGILVLGFIDWTLGIRFALLSVLDGDRGGYPVLLHWFSHFALQTGLIAFVYVQQRAALRNAAALHSAQLQSAMLVRQTLESRLQAMQARIDPQFLFETLAEVERLHDHEPATADGMLDDLILYLRAVLPMAKETASTLRTEFGLVRAYLNILSTGRRSLSFAIELPEALAATRFPPMILFPLVEAVIAHGGDTSPRRRNVDIAATGGRELAISVVARDAALSAPEIEQALDRTRERLATLFDAGAHLVVREKVPGSVEARLEIPHAYAAGAAR